MLKKLLTAGMTVLIATTTIGVASAQTTLRLGMGDPIDSDQGALAVRFKELVEGYSNGSITVTLFPGGALGAETEMIQNVRLGTLDFALVGIGNLTPFAPRMGALTLPYLIENTSDAVNVTTGPINAGWNTKLNESGFELIGWTYSNFRFLTNSVRPVQTLEDLRGMKVRVPQNPIMLATYEAWGAAPIAMSWPEVFTALQQGVVDGQDNPYIVNYSMKFHEVQDYLTEVHHSYSLQPLITGLRRMSRFSDEEQAMIRRAGLEAQMAALRYQLEEAENAKQGMIAGGIEVFTLADESQWIELAKEKVWPRFYEQVGGKEFIDELLVQLGR